MDVNVPPIPQTYDAYRRALRDFIAEHKPALEWKQRTGLRVPDRARDVELLRTYVRALYDAGYVLDRFSAHSGDPHEQRILEQELGAAGVPHVLGNPLVSGALRHFGTDQQRAAHLPPMARGDHIWTQLFSEPDAGSDLTSLQTRATRDGDDYVVVGQKVWSTWAQWSDYGYLLARSEPVEGPAGITAFILDMRSPGVDVRPLREMTGTTDFNEVFFDEVRIPVANVIGAPGEGWRVAGASLAEERSAVGGGGGADPLQRLVDLARQHRRRGQPAIRDGAVRQQLGDLAARARIQRHLGQTVATRAARGQMTAADAPLTKIWFSELNLEMAEAALALQGARSMAVEGDELSVDDGRWQDAFLYARAWTIAGGSNEIMRNLIAERGLGLPREPRGSW
ncbi:MAG TPA: acyl-CoA dehydrogenase family protein [Acidimicrobiales bacterium]|nr:acyl-CoA dehydrogenase family protein [Acidimicrobiales bacterium]